MNPSSALNLKTLSIARPRAGKCRFCSSTDLRRSRFRTKDVSQLLVLRWPVRCLNCSKRAHTGLHRALLAIPLRAAHKGDFGTKETWQGFTGQRKVARKSGDVGAT